jgi:hypothetical protein
MIFAYADPPYIGQAKKHYNRKEVDHKELINAMARGNDGWALSCSSPSLGMLLPLCPPKTRVMAWVKPFAVFKPGVNPAYAWEPILVWGGRKRTRQQPTVRDWVSANITLRKGLVGAKPEEFARWLFQVLNVEPSHDTFIDMFPGTGVMMRVWKELKRER